MNAKKSKALRKMIRNLESLTGADNLSGRNFLEKNPRIIMLTREEIESTGADLSKYEINNAESLTVDQDSESKPDLYKVKVKTGTLSNVPNSKRGIYRHFKDELVKIEKGRKH